jgi:branched-chain amino acid transport system substrate-binding protein
MNRRTLVIGAIAVVVIALIVGGVVYFTRPGGAQEIKIGAILPLTGDAGVYGTWAKQGIDLAVEEVNAEGGTNGKKIKVIYEDDQCQPEKAVSAINKLVKIDRVPIIIGALCSSATLAISPIANNTKTVIISPGSSSPKISEAGDYVFRNWPSDSFEGRAMAEFAYNTLQARRIAVLYINNEYGLGVKDVFTKRFEELGGFIIAVESYEQGATDFRTQLAKVGTGNPDAIYLPGHTNEIGQILRQAKEMGIRSQFLSVVAFESPTTLQIAGDAAEGVFYTTPAFDPESKDQLIQAFQQAYTKRYGKPAETFAATAYDALKIVVLAIKRGGYNSDGIKRELYNIQNYPGISGITTFDRNGDVIKPAMIKTVRNGKFEIYQKP